MQSHFNLLSNITNKSTRLAKIKLINLLTLISSVDLFDAYPSNPYIHRMFFILDFNTFEKKDSVFTASSKHTFRRNHGTVDLCYPDSSISYLSYNYLRENLTFEFADSSVSRMEMLYDQAAYLSAILNKHLRKFMQINSSHINPNSSLFQLLQKLNVNDLRGYLESQIHFRLVKLAHNLQIFDSLTPKHFSPQFLFHYSNKPSLQRLKTIKFIFENIIPHFKSYLSQIDSSMTILDEVQSPSLPEHCHSLIHHTTVMETLAWSAYPLFDYYCIIDHAHSLSEELLYDPTMLETYYIPPLILFGVLISFWLPIWTPFLRVIFRRIKKEFLKKSSKEANNL
jgi:hypothetical protein